MNRSLILYEPSARKYDFTDYVKPEDYIIAYRFNISKGWLIVVIRQMFNYRLAVSKRYYTYYDDMWCYEHMVDALLALYLWDPTCMDEPLGWIRNPTTGRRRAYDEDGRITREWIAG